MSSCTAAAGCFTIKPTRLFAARSRSKDDKSTLTKVSYQATNVSQDIPKYIFKNNET